MKVRPCSMETDGRTDRLDEADSSFSQFCKRALKVFKLNC